MIAGIWGWPINMAEINKSIVQGNLCIKCAVRKESMIMICCCWGHCSAFILLCFWMSLWNILVNLQEMFYVCLTVIILLICLVLGLVQSWSGVCPRWILRALWSERLPSTPLLSKRFTGESRKWSHGWPNFTPL